MSIAVGGHYFEHAVAEFQNRDVESATTKVEDDDFFVFFGLQTVGQCRGGRLVDDTLDFETSDFASVFSGLTLGIVEVGRNGDDGFGDWLAEEGFCVGFDF